MAGADDGGDVSHDGTAADDADATDNDAAYDDAHAPADDDPGSSDRDATAHASAHAAYAGASAPSSSPSSPSSAPSDAHSSPGEDIMAVIRLERGLDLKGFLPIGRIFFLISYSGQSEIPWPGLPQPKQVHWRR